SAGAKSFGQRRAPRDGDFARRQWRAGGRQARVHQVADVALMRKSEQVPKLMGDGVVGRVVAHGADPQFLDGSATFGARKTMHEKQIYRILHRKAAGQHQEAGIIEGFRSIWSLDRTGCRVVQTKLDIRLGVNLVHFLERQHQGSRGSLGGNRARIHHAFALRSGLAPDADLTFHDLGCGNCQVQQIGVHRYDNQILLPYGARGAASERSTPAMGLTTTGKGSITHAPGRCLKCLWSGRASAHGPVSEIIWYWY